jgi:hypothetical protein
MVIARSPDISRDDVAIRFKLKIKNEKLKIYFLNYRLFTCLSIFKII